MKVADSYDEFRKLLKRHGKKVTGLLPMDGIPLFQEFYRNVRCLDAEKNEGDGIVCYHGVTRDGGSRFEVGIMRVFRVANVPASEAGHRLRLSFAYPFVETIIHTELRDIGPIEDNQFCWSPDDQERLQKFIDTDPFIQALFSKPPSATKLRLENVWGVF
jgi:hypothetical protein